jgi:hypothetical protein
MDPGLSFLPYFSSLLIAKIPGAHCVAYVLTFTITDFVSASILKPFIGRLRPCQDPAIKFEINNIAVVVEYILCLLHTHLTILDCPLFGL